MRMANRAILKEGHPSPTVVDLIHSLYGATVFSKLDLRSGYHQLSLAPESKYITTFATHKDYEDINGRILELIQPVRFSRMLLMNK